MPVSVVYTLTIPCTTRFRIEDFREAPRTGKVYFGQTHSWPSVTSVCVGHNRSNHLSGHSNAPARAIMVTDVDGEPLKCVEGEEHISYAFTTFSVGGVQDLACVFELVKFTPDTLASDVLPTWRDGSMWKQSDYGLTPHSAARVKKQVGKNPVVDAFNSVPGMARATR